MLVTLEEAKNRLSIDFDYKDKEIESRITSIEGYLKFATGIQDFELVENEDFLNVAKDYILLKLFLDYYLAYTEIDNNRLTALMKQLQVMALVV